MTARPQRGAIALGIALVLLFAMTLVAFFANRALIFEQRSSANQYRSARAFEAAEAGLAWATARLNDPRTIDDACRPAAGSGASFRHRYAPLAPDLSFAPRTAARPGCSLGDGQPACSCPVDGGPAVLTDDAPAFTVEFAPVVGDPASLHVVSRGCSGPGAQCVPGAVRDADATATVQAVLKLRPAVRSLPVAAVAAGGNVAIGGGLRLVNTDAPTQGYAVHAGAAASIDAETSVTTLAGSPPTHAIAAHDPALAAIAADATGTEAFRAWFGSDPAAFADATGTRHLGTCGAACTSTFQAAHADGHDSFLVDGDLRLDPAGWPGGHVGSPERPILLVVRGQFALEAGVTVHGLVYVDTDAWAGRLDARLHGAVIARRHLAVDGSGTIRYDPGILARLRSSTGSLTRVPGSWLDARCTGTDPARACDGSE